MLSDSERRKFRTACAHSSVCVACPVSTHKRKDRSMHKEQVVCIPEQTDRGTVPNKISEHLRHLKKIWTREKWMLKHNSHVASPSSKRQTPNPQRRTAGWQDSMCQTCELEYWSVFRPGSVHFTHHFSDRQNMQMLNQRCSTGQAGRDAGAPCRFRRMQIASEVQAAMIALGTGSDTQDGQTQTRVSDQHQLRSESDRPLCIALHLH